MEGCFETRRNRMIELISCIARVIIAVDLTVLALFILTIPVYPRRW